MTLTQEIYNDHAFLDSGGMVTPSRHNGTGTSDNGLCYTAEYLILLALNFESLHFHSFERILACERNGLLYRKPLDVFPMECGQEGPDDYHAVLALCVVHRFEGLGRRILDYGWSHNGFYNNELPGSYRTKDGKIAWQAFMWRMPQFISLSYAAANKISPLSLACNVITALIIATSCMTKGKDLGNADARRLSWLLIIGMRDHSILCRLASWFWYRRLYKHYGKGGMKMVSDAYYKDHPFTRWFKDR